MKKILLALALSWAALTAPAVAQPRPIIIDHTSFGLYDQIPTQYLDAALASRFELADRSVGVNIRDGFDQCLAKVYGEAPSSCRTIKAGLPVEPWVQHVAHITFHGWPGLNLPNEMAGCTGSNGLWTGMVPCWRSFITGKTDNYDVVSVSPDYLLGTASNSMEHFFDQLPGSYDAYDLLDFAGSITPQMLWLTPSLSKGESSTGSLARLQGFSLRARAFAVEHNLTLVDLADISSHRRDGTLCTNAAGFPIQCDEWGSETSGGHLTYGATKVRYAQLILVALAQMAGWNPDAVPPPPPADTEKPLQGSACSGTLLDEQPLQAECTFYFYDNVGIAHVRLHIEVEDAAGNVESDTYEYPLVP